MIRAEFTNASVARVYERWAPVYDIVFGRVFEFGRQAAIDATNRVGGCILDVGVGTGIALPQYARTSRVFGVDLSEPMLRRAQQRVDRQKLDYVQNLSVMDAGRLAFADGSFNVVVAQYVINTVPHPEQTLSEFARVLAPGGEIILLNRVGADDGPRRVIERWLSPIVNRLGWRSEFPWTRMAHWLEGSHGIQLIERRLVPPFNHFALIRFGKSRVMPPSH
jgi:phosphatidylethanolamine/phosphatidyl-N-methylethanolamine N-methyltransferase